MVTVKMEKIGLDESSGLYKINLDYGFKYIDKSFVDILMMMNRKEKLDKIIDFFSNANSKNKNVAEKIVIDFLNEVSIFNIFSKDIIDYYNNQINKLEIYLVGEKEYKKFAKYITDNLNHKDIIYNVYSEEKMHYSPYILRLYSFYNVENYFYTLDKDDNIKSLFGVWGLNENEELAKISFLLINENNYDDFNELKKYLKRLGVKKIMLDIDKKAVNNGFLQKLNRLGFIEGISDDEDTTVFYQDLGE